MEYYHNNIIDEHIVLLSIIFNYFSVEGKSDRSDTLRRYLTNVNKLINDYAEIAAQCNVDTIRWYRTHEGRVRISTLTIGRMEARMRIAH